MRHLWLILLVLTFSAFGAGPYYISPLGSDSTGAGTLASPWYSLAMAQAAMEAGGTNIGPNNTTYVRAFNDAAIYTNQTLFLQGYVAGSHDDSGQQWLGYPGDPPARIGARTARRRRRPLAASSPALRDGRAPPSRSQSAS